MELDFRQEANNSRRMKAMLSWRDNVHIPFVVDALSSRRVMTMEYVRGHRIDDVESMRKDGISPFRVASMVTDDIVEMIYRHGFIHCDPHPGICLWANSNAKGEASNPDHKWSSPDQPFRPGT